MDITLRVVLEQSIQVVDWPAVPREGETVQLIDGRAATVTRVIWYQDAAEPSPYLILHPH